MPSDKDPSRLVHTFLCNLPLYSLALQIVHTFLYNGFFRPLTLDCPLSYVCSLLLPSKNLDPSGSPKKLFRPIPQWFLPHLEVLCSCILDLIAQAFSTMVMCSMKVRVPSPESTVGLNSSLPCQARSQK